MWAFIQAYGLIIVLVALFVVALFRGGDGDLDLGMGHQHGGSHTSGRGGNSTRGDHAPSSGRPAGGCH